MGCLDEIHRGEPGRRETGQAAPEKTGRKVNRIGGVLEGVKSEDDRPWRRIVPHDGP
jgi:hypothetical protein